MSTAAPPCVMYHHLHFYVESLKELSEYKAMEDTFNTYLADVKKQKDESVDTCKAAWTRSTGEKTLPEYKSQNQDLVEQLISGLGWRITAHFSNPETRTYLVTSPDKAGAQFMVSARAPKGTKKQKTADGFEHFKRSKLDAYFNAQGVEGCAVLGFEARPGQCENVYKRYSEKHPALVNGKWEYKNDKGDKFQVVEVFAYYSHKDPKAADKGTILRFVEGSGSWGKTVLPGLEPCEATFVLKEEAAAYFDHWVSNVVDRKQFLSTLEDTLGFTPKVDFNAGVVAAGEAIIESTVTGNSPDVSITDTNMALVNQEQIFLPINNALSEVGHVHLYLRDVGQGIQHVASRVQDIVSFIQRTNTVREATGKGFSFLNIPPSYYGRLTTADIQATGLSQGAAEAVMAELLKAKLVSRVGIVPHAVTNEAIENAVSAVDKKFANECGPKLFALCNAVRKGVYSNLYRLLRDNVDETTYVSIVRNKILVDIQGNDVLYQIFTSNILQKNPSDEAPFLEFIQRVCSIQKDASGKPKAIKPGCGGFGIRNFLTLFLSIEVSKAMKEVEAAQDAGNKKALDVAERKVQAFTNQLDEANPVLTAISDAMTEEGEARDAGDTAKADKACKAKEAGNAKLQEISNKYKDLLGQLREEAAKL